jgi:hypothetical protein
MPLPFVTRRTRQPQQAVRLDWSHPLARSLALAWVASAGDIDLVTGKSGSTEGTRPANQAFAGRIGRKFAGNGDISFGTRPDLSFNGLSNQTLFAEVFIPDTSSVSNFVCGRVQSNWDYSLSISSANQQFAFGTGGLAGGNAVLVPAASVGGGLDPYRGRPVPLCGTYDKVTAKLYVDGILKNSAALTGSFPNDTDQFAIGSRGGGNQAGQQLSGAYVSIVLIFKRTLSDAEVASLSANPWQLFASAPRLLVAEAASGTITSLTPNAGALAVTGYAPTLTQSTTQTVTSGAGGMAFAGFAPGVARTANQGVTPSAGAFTLTGFAPTVARTGNQSVTPSAGSLAFTGFAPTLNQTGSSSKVPGPGALTLTGFAPTVTRSAHQSVQPSASTLTLTGYAPTIRQGLLAPPPVVIGYTIMRAASVHGQVTALLASIARNAGTLHSTSAATTLLRQSAINNSSVLRDDALNQTVEFI